MVRLISQSVPTAVADLVSLGVVSQMGAASVPPILGKAFSTINIPASDVPVILVCPARIGSSIVGAATKSIAKPGHVSHRSTIAVGHWLATRASKAHSLQPSYSGSSLSTPDTSAIVPAIAQVAETFVTATYRKPVLRLMLNSAAIAANGT